MVEWGDVATWTGSVLTGSSFVVAGLAYRRSVRDRERSQAASVTNWIERADEGSPLLKVCNASNAVVYDVTAVLGDLRFDLRAVPPATTVDVPLPAAYDTATPALLRFRDASGRHWARERSGELRQFGGPRLSMSEAKRYARVIRGADRPSGR